MRDLLIDAILADPETAISQYFGDSADLEASEKLKFLLNLAITEGNRNGNWECFQRIMDSSALEKLLNNDLKKVDKSVFAFTINQLIERTSRWFIPDHFPPDRTMRYTRHVHAPHNHYDYRTHGAAIKSLITKAGACIHEWREEETGNTLLHTAVNKGNLEIFNLLLMAGLNPKVKNSEGLIPIRLIIHSYNKLNLFSFRVAKRQQISQLSRFRDLFNIFRNVAISKDLFCNNVLRFLISPAFFSDLLQDCSMKKLHEMINEMEQESPHTKQPIKEIDTEETANLSEEKTEASSSTITVESLDPDQLTEKTNPKKQDDLEIKPETVESTTHLTPEMKKYTKNCATEITKCTDGYIYGEIADSNQKVRTLFYHLKQDFHGVFHRHSTAAKKLITSTQSIEFDQLTFDKAKRELNTYLESKPDTASRTYRLLQKHGVLALSNQAPCRTVKETCLFNFKIRVHEFLYDFKHDYMLVLKHSEKSRDFAISLEEAVNYPKCTHEQLINILERYQKATRDNPPTRTHRLLIKHGLEVALAPEVPEAPKAPEASASSPVERKSL